MTSNAQKEKEFIPIRKASQLTGIGPQTLRQYAEVGKVEAYRTPTGQRMFNTQSLLRFIGHIPSAQTKRKIIYCRVSSKKQLDDLERQCQFLREKYPNHELVTDCGSGINFKRKGLQTLLGQTMLGNIQEIVVAHKDRLCRFGFDLIEFVCSQHNTNLIILDREDHRSSEQELADDILSIVTIFACKQMGKRKYSIKDKKDTSLPNPTTKSSA
jgi:putative resolvase